MMLEPHYQELLTAFVDGELSARQRRFVARLLRRSGEARLLLRQLQDDARQVRTLSSRSIPVDVTGSVLATIHQRKLRPTLRPRVPPVPTFPAWTGMAAAAAVLLIVGVGSFLHSSRAPKRPGNDQAQHQG